MDRESSTDLQEQGFEQFFNEEGRKVFDFLRRASSLDRELYDNLNLPKIVVIGNQSSGKSSVLKRLIGMDVLPVKSGRCTRCPLEIDIVGDTNLAENYKVEVIDCALPSDKKEREFSNQNDLKTTVSDWVDEIAKNRKKNVEGFSREPIQIKISSKHTRLHFTFVDLPGLFQSHKNEKAVNYVNEMVEEQLKSGNLILLWVVDGQIDLENNAGLNIIQSNGLIEKTIVVMTKLDLIQGKAQKKALSLLSTGGAGKKLSKMTWIGVVNGENFGSLEEKQFGAKINTNLEPWVITRFGIQNLRKAVAKKFFKALSSSNQIEEQLANIEKRAQVALEECGVEKLEGEKFNEIVGSLCELLHKTFFDNSLHKEQKLEEAIVKLEKDLGGTLNREQQTALVFNRSTVTNAFGFAPQPVTNGKSALPTSQGKGEETNGKLALLIDTKKMEEELSKLCSTSNGISAVKHIRPEQFQRVIAVYIDYLKENIIIEVKKISEVIKEYIRDHTIPALLKNFPYLESYGTFCKDLLDHLSLYVDNNVENCVLNYINHISSAYKETLYDQLEQSSIRSAWIKHYESWFQTGNADIKKDKERLVCICSDYLATAAHTIPRMLHFAITRICRQTAQYLTAKASRLTIHLKEKEEIKNKRDGAKETLKNIDLLAKSSEYKEFRSLLLTSE
jgi:GTP-binding protein EngB required for normal cell division